MPPAKHSAHRRWHRPGVLLIALRGECLELAKSGTERSRQTSHGASPRSTSSLLHQPTHPPYQQLAGQPHRQTHAMVLGKSQERLSVKRRQKGHGMLARLQQGILVKTPCSAGCERLRQACFCQSRFIPPIRRSARRTTFDGPPHMRRSRTSSPENGPSGLRLLAAPHPGSMRSCAPVLEPYVRAVTVRRLQQIWTARRRTT